MKNAPDTEEFIRQAVIEHLVSSPGCPYPANEFPLDEPLFESMILDSYGIVELIIFLESTWSLKIEVSEIIDSTLGTVNKIVTYVRACLTSAPMEQTGGIA